VFTVKNTGNLEDTYDLSCLGTGTVTCTGLSVSVVSLAHAQSTQVTAYYSTGAAGVGTLRLDAYSRGSDGTGDEGTFNVTATGPGLPQVSVTNAEVRYRDYAKCVAGCFHGAWSHSTPSYMALESRQAATLVYNSATHKPVPVVGVDISFNTYTTTLPSYLTLELRKASDNSLITLLNGTTSVYFGTDTIGSRRLVAAFDAQANGMGTGAHLVNAAVTAVYATTSYAATIQTVVVINDQSQSLFGAGVSLDGYQRLSFTNGRVAIAEGDGSIADFGPSPYTTPPGTFGFLTTISGGYRRWYADSSYVEFNSSGQMTKAVDPLGNTTLCTYDANGRLQYVKDPKLHMLGLYYDGANHLSRINVLDGEAGVRQVNYLVDASGRLIRAGYPDGYSDSLAYGSNGLLAGIYDRARNRTDLTYDAIYRLSKVQAPSITLYNGTSGRPFVNTTSHETAAWQPGTAGTSSAGLNVNIGVGFGAGIAWVRTQTLLLPATACKVAS
jgi:YD repeat-containing protein